MHEPLAASPAEEHTDEGATFAIIDDHICAPPSTSHPDGFQVSSMHPIRHQLTLHCVIDPLATPSDDTLCNAEQITES